MNAIINGIAFILGGIVKIAVWIVVLLGKIVFTTFHIVFIRPFQPYFQRDSRCHGSKFDRFGKKVEYNAKQYDNFMDKNPLVKTAGEEISTKIKQPVNTIGRTVYSFSAAVSKDNYTKIIKKDKKYSVATDKEKEYEE